MNSLWIGAVMLVVLTVEVQMGTAISCYETEANSTIETECSVYKTKCIIFSYPSRIYQSCISSCSTVNTIIERGDKKNYCCDTDLCNVESVFPTSTSTTSTTTI